MLSLSLLVYIHLAYVVFETKFNLGFHQVSYSISLAASLARQLQGEFERWCLWKTARKNRWSVHTYRTRVSSCVGSDIPIREREHLLHVYKDWQLCRQAELMQKAAEIPLHGWCEVTLRCLNNYRICMTTQAVFRLSLQLARVDTCLGTTYVSIVCSFL